MSSQATITTAQLRKQIRSAFTSNDASFVGLLPPAELLEHIEDYIASKNIASSITSLKEEPRLGETLVELSLSLPKANNESPTTKGRLCAWIILLAKLCPSGSTDLKPLDLVGLNSVWQNLLRPVLVPAQVKPALLFPVTRQGVQAAKDLTIWGFGDPPPSDSDSVKLPALEETLVKEYVELYSSYGATTSTEQAVLVEKSKKNLQDVLLTLGRQRPKNFFAYLAKVVPSSVAVRQAYLILISTFLKNFANLSHHMTTVKLLDQLLVCLLVEVDADIVHLSLSCILIAIPRIPTYLADYIPSLFAAYSKLVAFQHQQELEAFARRSRGESHQQHQDPFHHESSQPRPSSSGGSASRPALRSDLQWSTPPADPDHLPAASGPAYTARELFTYLYGIVPVNLTRFLEAPKAYLNKRDWLSPFELGLDEPMLKLDQVTANSTAFLQAHAFQPAIINLNVTSELSSLKTKWAKMDAATVIDECERLHIIRTQSYFHSGESNTMPSASRGRGRFVHRSADSVSAHTQSPDYTPRQLSLTRQNPTRLATATSLVNGSIAAKAETLAYEAEAAATPAVNGYISPPSPSPAATSNKRFFSSSTPPAPATPSSEVRSSSLPMEENKPMTSMATLSRALSHQVALPHHSVSVDSASADRELNVKAEKATQLAMMREKELNLLRAELQHELYLKAQHQQQMGAMHRHRIAESAYDADRNSLYQAIKHLRKQLVEKQAELDKIRQDTAAKAASSVAWEKDLRGKVKELLDERLQWRNETEVARAMAKEAQSKLDSQSAELEELGTKVFDLEASAALDKPQLERIKEYEETVNRLTVSLLMWDHDVAKHREQVIQNELLTSEWQKACTTSERAQAEIVAVQKALELEQERARNLAETLDSIKQQRRASDIAAIPPSLANSSYEQLRTNYERLRDRCIVLEQFKLEHTGQAPETGSESIDGRRRESVTTNGRSASGSSAAVSES